MAKVLKNQGTALLIADTGVTLPASPATYTIVAADYPLWAGSSDIITAIGAGTVVVNDGSFDLSKADGVALLQGNFKQADFIAGLKSGTVGDQRLKVEVTGLTTSNIIEGTNLYFTDERAQDAVGNALVDTSSIDMTYNDAGNTISATVLPAGVDHNSLQNYSANRHIDHTAVSINAGTGLTGGGDITATRTISMPAVGTAGTYGSSSTVPVVTTDAQGRVSAASTVAVDKLYDHWHGTTQYNASQLRIYTNVGTTDANGRVTFNMTTNGLAGGTALFTSVLDVNAIAVDNSGNAIQVPLPSIQSVTTSQLILRFVDGTSTGVLIGGTVVSMQYTGAGYTVYAKVTGVK